MHSLIDYLHKVQIRLTVCFDMNRIIGTYGTTESLTEIAIV